MRAAAVNDPVMDAEELFPKRADEALTALTRQDLDPLSVAELDARIAALHAEIARCQGKRDSAVKHRASADALFRR